MRSTESDRVAAPVRSNASSRHGSVPGTVSAILSRCPVLGRCAVLGHRPVLGHCVVLFLCAVYGLSAGITIASPVPRQNAPARELPVSYTISFENAVHHEAVVTVRFREVAQETLEVRMSRSSPGRYAQMEFSRNVYNFRAYDGRGRQLTVTRPDPHQWDIAGHDGTVEIRYTLYGDYGNGTFNGIDASHAHLNMPATFAWARGMEKRPIDIEFKIPPGSEWKIATQLAGTHHPGMYTAPDMQYFMDSPTELSDFTLRTWESAGGDSTYNFRLALHHQGTAAEADAYAAMCRRVVEEEWTVFGEFPRYDYGEYTFIADYLPWIGGDGMEHRNSTFILSTRPLRTNAVGLLGTVAHEFFHSWNVERIRPRSLQPFNFERSNMSAELWFAEGFTDYYDRLLQIRAGVFGIDRFASSLGGNLDGVVRAPGRKYFNAGEMSRKAAVIDGAIFPDRMNLENAYLSYYPFGDAIATALDLTLRARPAGTTGLTLDGFMRTVWRAHGRTEIPYTNDDLRELLAGYTGDAEFAKGFFSKYVEGHDIADYATLLAPAGFLLRMKDSGKASFGPGAVQFSDSGLVMGSGTIESSAWYRAGLDRSDTVFTVGGEKIAAQADLDSLFAKHKPGQTLDIEYIQRGEKRKGKITFIEEPTLEVVTYEKAGMPVTDAILSFRTDWLSTKNPAARPLVKYCHTCKREYTFEYEFCHYDGSKLTVTREEEKNDGANGKQ